MMSTDDGAECAGSKLSPGQSGTTTLKVREEDQREAMGEVCRGLSGNEKKSEWM